MAGTVLLTRPEGQNESLADRLDKAGIDIRVIPMLSIESLPVDATAKRLAMDLDRFDHLVFVSQNAVEFGMPLLERYWPQWPSTLRWHAVGNATAARLDAWGITPGIPGEATSEGLLASGEFDDVRGQQVLIVRGEGGREALAQGLEERGASVRYLEVYRRAARLLTAAERQALARCLPFLAVIYSAETLESLSANLGNIREGLSLVVPSARVKNVAVGLGLTDVTVAEGADEDAMYSAILRRCA